MTDQEAGAPEPETAPADDPTATEPVEEAIEGGSVSVSQPEPEGATEEDHEEAEAAEEDDES